MEFAITIDPGGKCSIEAIDSYDGAGLAYEIVVNDQTYQNYMVLALSLEKGKTYKDLQDYNDKFGGKLGNPPSWSKFEAVNIVSPMSRTVNAPSIDTVPLYFV